MIEYTNLSSDCRNYEADVGSKTTFRFLRYRAAASFLKNPREFFSAETNDLSNPEALFFILDWKQRGHGYNSNNANSKADLANRATQPVKSTSASATTVLPYSIRRLLTLDLAKNTEMYNVDNISRYHTVFRAALVRKSDGLMVLYMATCVRSL